MEIENWKKRLAKVRDDPWSYSGDPDHPKCPCCKKTMDFHGHDENGDFPLGKGFWLCENCGFKITEEDLRGYVE